MILSFLAACTEEPNDQISVETGLKISEFFTPVPALAETAIAAGQVIYVPVYFDCYI